MRLILSYLWWPLLLGLCLLGTKLGLDWGHPIWAFNITYVLLALSLTFLERRFSHASKWLEHDGQVKTDLLHTLFNKGIVQVVVVVTTIMHIASHVEAVSLKLWPVHWPLVAQICLAVAVMDFGLYWKHRLAHEQDWLWPFHAVHHSAPRLWFFNTGRFHIVDTVTSLILALPLLYLLGAPEAVFSWAAAITAYIGMLTHCNVEMRFGPLSWIFNTPELHRWHHSRKLRESNSNYGENLMLWDHVFGSYLRPDRAPPVNIGISHPMPATFWGQLKTPFIRGALVSMPNAYKKFPKKAPALDCSILEPAGTIKAVTVIREAA